MSKLLSIATSSLLTMGLVAAAEPQAPPSLPPQPPPVSQAESEDPEKFFPVNTRSISDISRKRNVRDYSNPIVSCGSASSGITCTLSDTYSTSIEISAEVGFTRKDIAAKLGTSAGYSRSVNVQCSAKLKKGQQLVAYPKGTRYKYRIKKVTLLETTYSTWRYAFAPDGGITCAVRWM